MKSAGALFVRDIKVFLRDPTALALAIGSPVLIGIILLVVVRESVGQYFAVNFRGTTGNSYAVFDTWVFAGLAVVASFSAAAGVLLGFTGDRLGGRLGLYAASPVKTWQVPAAHLAAAPTVAFVASFGVMTIGQMWALATRQPLVPFVPALGVIIGLVVVAILFSALSGLVVTFIRSVPAYGAYCLVGSVVAGFLAFAWWLPGSVANPSPLTDLIMLILPFAPAGSLVAGPVMTPVLNTGVPAEDWTVINTAISWLVVLLWTAALAALGLWRMSLVVRPRTVRLRNPLK